MKKLDIICVGNMNFDIIFATDQLPEKHEKMRCEEVYVGLGGAAGNTAQWLARLKMKVGFIGCIGEDVFGQAHLDFLAREGIDAQGITKANVHSGLAVVLSKGESKRMIKTSGANLHISPEKEYIARAKHIHMSSGTRELISGLIQTAKNQGISTSYDPGENGYYELFSQVDYLMMNEDECKKHCGTKNTIKALKRFKINNLIVGLNGGGCRLVSSDGVDITVPTLGQKAVDTTGVGDAMDAGFLYGILNGYDLEISVKCAVAAASVKVKSIGARNGNITPYHIAQIVEQLSTTSKK